MHPEALSPHPIVVLPPEVAERIAAGEVIERPAAVVKELVENALDAGATEVSVRLSDGGRAEIEVTDNGSGIPFQQLSTALERHATSKLRTLSDLDRIQTLGFRGEALPSIAAVTQFSILSQSAGQSSAYEVLGGIPGLRAHSKPQPKAFGLFLGKKHGTRIQAQGLFSQVPARLKFLKSASSEASQVRDWMERLALTRPDVGFTLNHQTGSQNKLLLSLKPSSEAMRVQELLGEGEDFPVLSHTETRGVDQLEVRVHWLQGLSLPQTRKLVQVVNGRALRDRLLQQSVLNPFRQLLLPGQFPALAVFLDLPPSELDVNVHPTKTEVRFLEPSKIFKAVQSAIQALVQRHGAGSFVSGPQFPDSPQQRELMHQPFGDSPSSGDYSSVPLPLGPFASSQGHKPDEFAMPDFSPSNSAAPTFPEAPSFGSFATAFKASASAPPHLNAPTLAVAPDDSPRSEAGSQWQTSPGAQPDHKASPPLKESPYLGRYVGILFHTYIVFEKENELWLIDQHAAHERVQYEKLRARFLNQGQASQRQALLIPEPIQLDALTCEKLEPRLPWLLNLGFEAEPFGESSVLFRAIPPEWGTDALRVRLKSLCLRLAELESPEGSPTLKIDSGVFEKLASTACRSSVRAGDGLTEFEAVQLARALFSCENPWNCPHGRPSLVRLPSLRLEEWFQRRAPSSSVELN